MRYILFIPFLLLLYNCAIDYVTMTGGDNKQYFSFEEIKKDLDARYKKTCFTNLPQFNENKESITIFIPDLKELESLISNPETDWKGKNDGTIWSAKANALIAIYSFNFFSQCKVFENMFSPVEYKYYDVKLDISADENKHWEKLIINNKFYNTKYAIFLDDSGFIMKNKETGLYEKFDNPYFIQLFSPLKNEQTEFTLISFYEYFLDTKKLVD